LLKFDITKQQQKFNKKVLISRNFIGADPFLGPVKGANVAAHIQFVVVAFIQPHGASVGFTVVRI
jgi:hypothetical protein